MLLHMHLYPLHDLAILIGLSSISLPLFLKLVWEILEIGQGKAGKSIG